MKEMGKTSSFAYQKLTQLEEKANRDFHIKNTTNKNTGSVVIMENPLATTDIRLQNKEMMRGKYKFEFPEKANTLRKKINRVALDPTAFQLYKRGDLSSKIDVIDTKTMRMAQLLHKLVKSAEKDKELSVKQLEVLKGDW